MPSVDVMLAEHFRKTSLMHNAVSEERWQYCAEYKNILKTCVCGWEGGGGHGTYLSWTYKCNSAYSLCQSTI